MSCNRTAKENKVNHYKNPAVDIFTILRVGFVLMVFRWTGVSSCDGYVLEKWLCIRKRYLFLILKFGKSKRY